MGQNFPHYRLDIVDPRKLGESACASSGVRVAGRSSQRNRGLMVAVGKRIGNYRVLRKLGQGGMGAVYEAIQEEIGRRAAIKVLLPEFAKDTVSIQRFFNEARAVNIIHHPGLVGVFESGRLDDGAAFIVMEYLDGELLRARLTRLGALEQLTALNLGRQIASALAAAHQKGIIHRDLKPDNVMVIADPETVDGERVKIFDFGLAKLRSSSLPPDAVANREFRTQSGMVLGTPTHMAPEQCRGASTVDGKADVYSLGVILFEMLVGHPPFVGQSVGELISMHLRDKPPSLRKLDRTIPPGLADLVAAMLAKEPTQRPDMIAVVQQLESLGAHRTRRVPALKIEVEPETPSLGFADTRHGQPEPNVPSQATGQPERRLGNHQYALALALATLLVAGSALLLFADVWPSESPAQARPTVTWMIDSEPQGAQLAQLGDQKVLGTTPWYRREAAKDGSLRLLLKLPGYRDSTVIVNLSENSNQKVVLEKLREPEPATPALLAAPTQTAGSAAGPVASAPTRPGPAPSVEKRWQVGSRPEGALVVRVSDGKILGKTPWAHSQLPSSEILRLSLQLPGYQPMPVLLDLSESSQQTMTLQRTPPATRPLPGRAPTSRSPTRNSMIPYEK